MSENSENIDESPPSVRVPLGGTGDGEGLSARPEVVLGRGLECDVVIKDTKASRRHCRLIREDGGYVLEDLESRNGTFVEGQRIEGRIKLSASQSFKIGDTIVYLA